jgi:polar amino acid transport system substrate-binding protein
MKRIKRILAAAALLSGFAFPSHLNIYTEISPPDEYLNPSGGLEGFAVEIVREIQKRVGNADPIEVVPWIRGYQEIQTRPDVVLFSMAKTEDRDPLFQWVGPLRETENAFFLRADSTTVISNLEDAKKLKLIGVYKEDVRDLYLTKAGFQNLDRSVDTMIMLKKLMSGRIDGMVTSTQGIDSFIKAAGYKPDDIKKSLTFLKTRLYIAFSKGAPDLAVASWSKALEAMKKDGTFERIYHNYYSGQPLLAETKSY